jgi:hypothetical protein
MKATWRRVLVLSALSVGLVKCFGAGENGGGNTCNAFVQAQVTSACGACVKDKCSSQISAAASPCADFVTCICANGGTAGGCSSKLDEASCQPANQALQSCAQSNCPSECAGADSGMGIGDATVPDSGGMDSATPDSAESGLEASLPESSPPDSSMAETSVPDAPVAETGSDSAADANDSGCPSGETSCGGTCTDTTKDGKNCGTCGTTCSGGETCTASACACPTGQAFCAGACTDTSTDNANCGGCGKACSGGETCVGSMCQCPTGQSFCSSACTNTTSDPLNCGSCGKTCGPYLNATPSCGASQCMYTCDPGFLKCSSAVDCSINTQTDVNNCGTCGHRCVASGQICSAGVCFCPKCPTCCG